MSQPKGSPREKGKKPSTQSIRIRDYSRIIPSPLVNLGPHVRAETMDLLMIRGRSSPIPIPKLKKGIHDCWFKGYTVIRIYVGELLFGECWESTMIIQRRGLLPLSSQQYVGSWGVKGGTLFWYSRPWAFYPLLGTSINSNRT